MRATGRETIVRCQNAEKFTKALQQLHGVAVFGVPGYGDKVSQFFVSRGRRVRILHCN